MLSLLLSASMASIAAGVPDIFAASLLSGASPGRILQLVASGLLGEASYEKGRASIVLGLVLQIAMSFVIALIYNMAFSRAAVVRVSPLLFGALYGGLVFVVMNFVVVPLSRAHPKPRWELKTVIAMLIVMVLFGEIIAFIAATLVSPVA